MTVFQCPGTINHMYSNRMKNWNELLTVESTVQIQNIPTADVIIVLVIRLSFPFLTQQKHFSH